MFDVVAFEVLFVLVYGLIMSWFVLVLLLSPNSLKDDGLLMFCRL